MITFQYFQNGVYRQRNFLSINDVAEAKRSKGTYKHTIDAPVRDEKRKKGKRKLKFYDHF